jgi:N-acetylglucosaminyl-diphospho-decaprenol L-rhamnosyltransferase
MSGRPAAPTSAVVVNYDAGRWLTDCVASLRRESVDEIVVVDNRSTDDSLRGLESHDQDVRVVRLPRNRGYGAAANVGAGATRGPSVLVCNPDLVLEPSCLSRLEAVLASRPDVAIVGPRLLTVDGETYPSARTFPTLSDSLGHAFLGLIRPDNRFTARYKMRDLDRTLATDVDWVSGACFLARRDAFESVGGFDEAYFMYVEDVDLCWRLHRAGWSVRYEPAASVTHLQGLSTARHPYRMIAAHHRSLLRFAARSSTGTRRALLPLVAAGLAVRTVLAWADHAYGSRRPSSRGAIGTSRTPD